MRVKVALQLDAVGRFNFGGDPMNDIKRLADARDVLSVRDVQQMRGIGRNAAYELIASGRLRSVRVTRRRIVVTKQALEAFLGALSNRLSAVR